MAQLCWAMPSLHPLHSWQRQCHCWLSWLDHSVLSKDKQVFVLKDSISKGMDFANDLCRIECFLHLPHLPVCDVNLTDNQWIFIKQNEIDEVLKWQQNLPDRHFNRILDEKEIICCATPGNNSDTQLKFASINSMIPPTLHCFHAMLGNPGTCCMCALLQARYHHLPLCMHIKPFMWQIPTH